MVVELQVGEHGEIGNWRMERMEERIGELENWRLETRD